MKRAPGSIKDVSPLSWGGGGGRRPNRIDPRYVNFLTLRSIWCHIWDLFRLCPPVHYAPPLPEHVPLHSKSSCKNGQTEKIIYLK